MNIGIDLGTTNSALAFIDPGPDDVQAGAEDSPKIQVLDIPQYVAADESNRSGRCRRSRILQAPRPSNSSRQPCDTRAGRAGADAVRPLR
jgi:molecular chaperone DnaK (HSP70)